MKFLACRSAEEKIVSLNEPWYEHVGMYAPYISDAASGPCDSTSLAQRGGALIPASFDVGTFFKAENPVFSKHSPLQSFTNSFFTVTLLGSHRATLGKVDHFEHHSSEAYWCAKTVPQSKNLRTSTANE